jgi:aquaporin Z
MATLKAAPRPSRFPSAGEALRADWPLYLMEAAELAAFMVSACVFDVLLYHPDSPLIGLNSDLRRALMGLSMGLTAVAIIKSPWGKRSGAHFNPAITCTFYRLGKIGPYDSICYVGAHFAGAIAGVGLSALLLGSRLADAHVSYVVTVPGIGGNPGAFAAETFMAALLMGTVLATSASPRLARWTTWLVGLLIVNYVFFLAPVSGFSINPARTVGSAVFAHVYTALWIYFTAPLLGMFFAAELFVRFPTPVRPEHGVRHFLTHRHLVQRKVLHRPAAEPPQN